MSDGPAPLLPRSDLTTFFNKLHQERDALFEEVATFTIESKSIDDDVREVLNKLA